MNMPPPSIKNDEFQILTLGPSQIPLLLLALAYQSCSHSFHNSLGLFSTSCDSLEVVNNSYLAGEIYRYWLLVWWLSRLEANILLECKGMWSSYLEERWWFQPVCLACTAASVPHTVHYTFPSWYYVALSQCYYPYINSVLHNSVLHMII